MQEKKRNLVFVGGAVRAQQPSLFEMCAQRGLYRAENNISITTPALIWLHHLQLSAQQPVQPPGVAAIAAHHGQLFSSSLLHSVIYALINIMSYYSQQFASGAQHTSWQQPSQAQQQFTGHASSMHPSSSSLRSAETDMPWRDGSYQPYNPPHSSSQQWTAPAAAGGGSASFNYGFGQASFDQQPSMPSYSHASQPTHSMGRLSSYHSTQPAQQQQQAGPGPGAPQFPPDYPNTDIDDLKLVKNLPAAFQPIFSFR